MARFARESGGALEHPAASAGKRGGP